MLVRPQRPDDGAAVRRLLTAAFADGGRVAELAAALRSRADRPDGGALVAESGGELVGHVQLSRAWVDAERALVEVSVLSPLGVAPARQRCGIGRALCAAALARARELATPAVFVEGDPRYYARLGWQGARGLGFAAPSGRIPDAAFQVVLLPSWRAWMTGRLVYNDTFWAFDCVGPRTGS